MFGRPVMTEDEMEAINSGGAESAPQVCFNLCVGISCDAQSNSVALRRSVLLRG